MQRLQICDVLLPGERAVACFTVGVPICPFCLLVGARSDSTIMPSGSVLLLPWANPQEHQLEHWKQVEGGHKAECRRLKAEKEAAEAEAAAELARLSLRAAGGRSSGAGCSGRGSSEGAGPSRRYGSGRGGSATTPRSGVSSRGGRACQGGSGGADGGSSALTTGGSVGSSISAIHVCELD